MKREIMSALLAAAALFAQTNAAHACACCTEPGQRFEYAGPIDTYLRAEMAQIRFAPTAILFSDAGFPDSVKGIRNPAGDPYRVRASIGNVVSFEFTDPSGRIGRLQFPRPNVMSRFEVDPRAAAGPVPPNGPDLYKEWRLQRGAQFVGPMAAGGPTVFATLILHGDGNSCSAAPNFKRWTLSVKGRGVAFTFLGGLVP
ncbi:MAG: hypothetical protein ACKVRO_02305 [Micropepsaceae bacterium]